MTYSHPKLHTSSHNNTSYTLLSNIDGSKKGMYSNWNSMRTWLWLLRIPILICRCLMIIFAMLLYHYSKYIKYIKKPLVFKQKNYTQTTEVQYIWILHLRIGTEKNIIYHGTCKFLRYQIYLKGMIFEKNTLKPYRATDLEPIIIMAST